MLNKGQKWYGPNRSIKNGMDLIEAEDIKKRWQEYTEELYKKGLHDPDNHNEVITYLEPDMLECKVKWALGNITIHISPLFSHSPDNHFAFLHFFFLGMVLIPVSCTMSRTSIHSSSGTLSIRSNPLSLFVTSSVQL